jgi:group I intron endonuclease
LEKKKIIAGTYRILNLINNKVYNGSSTRISYRLSSHKKALKNKKGQTKHLQRAFDKYGEKNFSFEVREEIAIVWDWKNWTKKEKKFLSETLFLWEQKHIDEDESYKPEKGYNVCKVAGSTIGYEFTKDQREYLSNVCSGELNGMFGKKHSKKTRKKMSRAVTKAQTGKPLSDKHKDSLRKGKLGKKNPMYGENVKDHMTPEAYVVMLAKISKAMKGKKFSEEHKKHISDSRKRYHMRSIVECWS